MARLGRITFAILALALAAPGAWAQSTHSPWWGSTRSNYWMSRALTDAGFVGVPRFATPSLPTCDATNVGAVAFDTSATQLVVCNGTSWVAPAVTGSGVAKQVAIWDSTSTIRGDADFTFDYATDTLYGKYITGATGSFSSASYPTMMISYPTVAVDTVYPLILDRRNGDSPGVVGSKTSMIFMDATGTGAHGVYGQFGSTVLDNSGNAAGELWWRAAESGWSIYDSMRLRHNSLELGPDYTTGGDIAAQTIGAGDSTGGDNGAGASLTLETGTGTGSGVSKLYIKAARQNAVAATAQSLSTIATFEDAGTGGATAPKVSVASTGSLVTNTVASHAATALTLSPATGQVLFPDGTELLPSMAFTGQANTGLRRVSSSFVTISVNGANRVGWTNSGEFHAATDVIGWGTVGSASADLALYRDAAANLQLGADTTNSTAAIDQTLSAADSLATTGAGDSSGADLNISTGTGTGIGAAPVVNIKAATLEATGTTAQTADQIAAFYSAGTLSAPAPKVDLGAAGDTVGATITGLSTTGPLTITSAAATTGTLASAITLNASANLVAGDTLLLVKDGDTASAFKVSGAGAVTAASSISSGGFIAIPNNESLRFGPATTSGSLLFHGSTNAIRVFGAGSSDTFNDATPTAGPGTLATRYQFGQLAPTMTATDADGWTYTNAATWYIGGAPTASTNVTIGTPYALLVDAGNVRFDGGLLTKRSVVPNTGTATPAEDANSYTLYTNTGDGDGSAITLPNDPTAGTTFSAAVTVAQTVTITTGAGESLAYLTAAGAADTCAASITSNVIGASITLTAVTGGAGAVWMVTSHTGIPGTTWVCND